MLSSRKRKQDWMGSLHRPGGPPLGLTELFISKTFITASLKLVALSLIITAGDELCVIESRLELLIL